MAKATKRKTQAEAAEDIILGVFLAVAIYLLVVLI